MTIYGNFIKPKSKDFCTNDTNAFVINDPPS